MSNDELKVALLNGQPVVHGDITYKCVSAIIYRKSKEGIHVTVELQDKCGHSVSIVDASRICVAI